MQICPQCNGGKSTIGGIESRLDPTQNSETMQMSGSGQGAIPCTQCGGLGYY